MNPRRDAGDEPLAPSGSVASISSLLALCVHDFHSLLQTLPGQDSSSELLLNLQDELGRLRVWAGNFGAHRKQTDRLSLDHRLREAPDLHREIRSHIGDVTEAIRDGMSPTPVSALTD